jgi:hypothetical protein
MDTKGRFPWRANVKYGWQEFAVEGRSFQPLLDACRELKRMGVASTAEAALFREGATDWDLKTTIGYGASRTVDENRRAFARYKPDTRF